MAARENSSGDSTLHRPRSSRFTTEEGVEFLQTEGFDIEEGNLSSSEDELESDWGWEEEEDDEAIADKSESSVNICDPDSAEKMN